jgi:hypothetical protein
MTDTRDWVWEKATDLADVAVSERHNMGMYAVVSEAAATTLREAEERGSACKEQDDQLLWRETSDRACLAERKAIEDRLREPDDAMVKAVLERLIVQDWRDGWLGPRLVREVGRTLANALFPSSETPETPSKEGE